MKDRQHAAAAAADHQRYRVGVARVGLARSRHATQGNDQPSKKHKKTSFAHNETTEIQTSDGSKILKCNHCTERVSSNISRRTEHLLICKAFLASTGLRAWTSRTVAQVASSWCWSCCTAVECWRWPAVGVGAVEQQLSAGETM